MSLPARENPFSDEQMRLLALIRDGMQKHGFTMSGGHRVPGWLEKFEQHPDVQEMAVQLDSWYPASDS